MQPSDAANSIFLMAEKLSDIIDEMPDTSNLERLKIDACKAVCENISNLMVVLCTDMGTSDQNITYIPLSELSSAETGRLHCLVIPAEPGDVELSALNRWGKK